MMNVFSKAGIFSLLILIGLLLLLFSGELIFSLAQTAQSTPVVVRLQPHITPAGSSLVTPTGIASPQVSATATPSTIIVPNHVDVSPLQLSTEQYVLYVRHNTLYLVSIAGSYVQAIPTKGSISNNATLPILMPSGQILYSGEGIWMTSISGGTQTQIAPLDPGQVITSMAVSDDGKMIAWSTEPTSGIGMIAIHAGSLANPAIVYEQSALDCPCFRIFSFLHGATTQADTTLLLTDDRGSHEAVQYGAWSLDLSMTPATLQPILDEDSQQGPLALTPSGNIFLYSSSEGAVPEPADNSVPADIAALPYANDLNITTLSDSSLTLGKTQVILPEQDNLPNNAQYHWVTTPIFSPDAHTLAYVEFSSDNQDPYDRHSALYTVPISGSGAHLQAGKPQLLATFSSQLVELGPWFNNQTLTFYADGILYAIDTQSGSFTAFAQPGGYARIIAAVGSS